MLVLMFVQLIGRRLVGNVAQVATIKTVTFLRLQEFDLINVRTPSMRPGLSLRPSGVE